MRRWFCTVALASAFLPCTAVAEADLTFLDDVSAAREHTDGLIVLYFSSPRCGWCHKLESISLGDPRTLAVAQRLTWVKVPQAQLEMLAGVNGVMGLPCLLVINDEGLEVARHTGYLPPGPLADFLRDALEAPEPRESHRVRSLLEVMDPAKLDQADNSAVELHVRAVVEELAGSTKAGRTELLEALASAGGKIRPALCELLSSEQLATRSAAYEALAYGTQDPLPFDPFADTQTRNRQIRAWREKLGIPPLRACTTQTCPAVPADDGLQSSEAGLKEQQ